MALTGFLNIILFICCCLCDASSVHAETQSTWHGLPHGYNILAESILAGFIALCLLAMALLFWNRTLKTAVKKQSAELKQTEESLHLTSFAMKHAADSVFWLTANASIVEANEAACRSLGYTREELLQLKVPDVDTLYNAELWQQHWEELKAHGSRFFESNQRTKGGRIFPVEITANYIRFNDKEYNCAFVRDITDRKQVDMELQQREHEFRSLAENLPDVVSRINREGRHLYVNSKIESISGLPQAAFIGKTNSELGMPEDLLVQWECAITQVFESRKNVMIEFDFPAPSGVLNFEALLIPEFGRNGEVQTILGISRNVSERKQANDALRQSEERLRIIFETSESGIILVNPQGVIDFANRRMAEMFAMTHDEMIGTSYSEHLHESEKLAGDERMRQLILGKIKSVATERRYIRKDGSDFLGYLSGRRLENPDGSLRALVGFIADITERKNSEERRLELERRLLHSQKLESLGILSGGIAHDFNNLLLAVLGNLDLALRKLPEEAIARKNIGQAITASRHAAKLTNMMLAYSGKGSFINTELSLTELVEENVAMLSAAISKNIKLDLQLDHALPLIMADAGQIQQVVMNLITNASEAIGDAKGSITLATGVNEFDQSTLNHSRLEEKLPSGGYVWLEVRDTGCGMDVDTLHKLFDPFFTTKFTGRGLGMSAVLGIIRAHKGAFLVESRPAAGTTIKVLFPIVDFPRTKQANTPVAVTTDVTAPTGSGAILIVDDEEMIRGVCLDLIEELGFEALVAGDGEEALRIFREKGNRIRLVLLDQVMPGMDGVSVFKELRRIRPDIKVLLASGYSEQEVSERFIGLGLDGFIQKPFSMNSLSDELRRVLGRRVIRSCDR